MNVLPLQTRVKIAAALADGVSLSATERLTGATRKTVGSFLLTLGDGCSLVHDAFVRDVHCDAIECDEVWAFIGKKEGHLVEGDPAEWGDAYTFVANDLASRAVISHFTDKRTAAATVHFAADLRARVLGKPQITTDGFKAYIDAIERAFGTRVHYAQNLKTYAADEAGGASRDDVRYSRGRCIASQKVPILGSPDESKITTAHAERGNLNTRMNVRRLTRLTNCFSRRLVFLRAAISLHFAAYNFTRVHSSLRITPAMALGVTDHIWSMEELVVAALDALDDAPPSIVPPPSAGLTAGMEAGVRLRAARHAAARGSPPASREARVIVPMRRAERTTEPTPSATTTPPTLPAPASTTATTPPTQDFRWLW